jgi:hypothetical protein
VSRSLEGHLVRVLAFLPLAGILGLLWVPGSKDIFWLLIAAGFLGNAVRGLWLARDSYSVERVGEFLGWFMMLFGLLAAYAACHRLFPSLVRSGRPLSDLAGDYRLEQIRLAVERDGSPDARALAILCGPPAAARGLLESLVFALANARAAGCPTAADLGARAQRTLRGEGPPEPLFRSLAETVRTGDPACVRAVSVVCKELAQPALLGALHLTMVPEGMGIEIDVAPSDGSSLGGRVTGILRFRDLDAARTAGIHRARVSAQVGSLWTGILPPELLVHVVMGPDSRPLRLEGTAPDGGFVLFHAELRSCR